MQIYTLKNHKLLCINKKDDIYSIMKEDYTIIEHGKYTDNIDRVLKLK